MALVGIARDEGRAVVAAFENGLAGIDEKAALALAGLDGVALVAALDEDGADVLFKESDLRVIRRRGHGHAARAERQCQGDGSSGLHVW